MKLKFTLKNLILHKLSEKFINKLLQWIKYDEMETVDGDRFILMKT